MALGQARRKMLSFPMGMPLHMQKRWNPPLDLASIISVSGYTFGFVVKGVRHTNVCRNMSMPPVEQPGKIDYGSAARARHRTCCSKRWPTPRRRCNSTMCRLKGNADLMARRYWCRLRDGRQ
jgi:hypothetical protein